MPISVQFSRTGDPDVLEFVNDGLLSPGDDDVLIEVRAIGLNRADAMFRRGEYIFEPVLPAKLGTEAAGIVRGLGKGVTHVAVGDRVNLVPSFRMGAYGIYGDEIVVPGHAVVAQPEGLTFEQGACIWVMFLTAYGPLIEDARIQPGENVVISAASSSVGLAAIQLANMAGAIPIALTRTSAKRQRLFDAGAKHVIATSEADPASEILRITDGRGVRVAVDPVGGDLVPKLIEAMPKGVIYLYGALGGTSMTVPVLQMLGQRVTIKGWIIADLLADEDRKRAAIRYVTDGLRRGLLSPVIDHVFAFGEMVEAHRRVESGKQFGKVAISLNADRPA